MKNGKLLKISEDAMGIEKWSYKLGRETGHATYMQSEAITNLRNTEKFFVQPCNTEKELDVICAEKLKKEARKRWTK